MLQKIVLLFFISAAATSCSHTIYIVRHGEKATTPAGNPVLTEAGAQRAERLKDLLQSKKIQHIFSTNTTRTLSTAQPTSTATGIPIATYMSKPDSAFIQRLRTLKKNALVVGHSNTIDDIANLLCRRTVVAGDIPDSVYSHLFIVKIKGRKARFTDRRY
jgi:phosphohistidine phosphatase SixA